MTYLKQAYEEIDSAEGHLFWVDRLRSQSINKWAVLRQRYQAEKDMQTESWLLLTVANEGDAPLTNSASFRNQNHAVHLSVHLEEQIIQ